MGRWITFRVEPEIPGFDNLTNLYEEIEAYMAENARWRWKIVSISRSGLFYANAISYRGPPSLVKGAGHALRVMVKRERDAVLFKLRFGEYFKDAPPDLTSLYDFTGIWTRVFSANIRSGVFQSGGGGKSTTSAVLKVLKSRYSYSHPKPRPRSIYRFDYETTWDDLPTKKGATAMAPSDVRMEKRLISQPLLDEPARSDDRLSGLCGADHDVPKFPPS